MILTSGKKNMCLVVQFNEANFDLIKKYVSKYDLPGLAKLLHFSVFETKSETEYVQLEPWIQWYSFYTQKTFAEHCVFHLGDCLKIHNYSVFDRAADSGAKVGLFGAMNHHPNKNFSIYIPDAWTETHPDKSYSSRLVSSTLRSLVNNNTRLRIGIKELIGIMIVAGLPRSARWFGRLWSAVSCFARKDRTLLAALFDDFFLDYSLRRSRACGLNVGVVFLNGLAHIQHHAMLSSEFVASDGYEMAESGDSRDEMLVALQAYDRMFMRLFESLDLHTSQLWVLTGLTQIPCRDPFAYWRFRNHEDIIARIVKNVQHVYPRMTRDFEIEFFSESDAKAGASALKDCQCVADGKSTPAFGFIDVSKNRVFASFIYSGPSDDVELTAGSQKFSLLGLLDFVAWKNGIHSSKGWGATNSSLSADQDTPIHIKDVGSMIFPSAPNQESIQETSGINPN